MEPTPQAEMIHGTGSMGSECRSFHVPPETIPFLADVDWSGMARRVFMDPVSGLIALMSPSRAHEIYSRGADRLLDALGEAYDLRVASLGSTRWHGPRRGGAEADACFWLGETADAWDRAALDGEAAEDEFEAVNPPDLVVEVERTHGDGRKSGFYRELGVPEMWRIDAGPDGLEVEFLDLQAGCGPQPMSASAQLPLCTQEFVMEGLPLAARARRDELRALIERALAAEKALPGPGET